MCFGFIVSLFYVGIVGGGGGGGDIILKHISIPRVVEHKRTR